MKYTPCSLILWRSVIGSLRPGNEKTYPLPFRIVESMMFRTSHGGICDQRYPLISAPVGGREKPLNPLNIWITLPTGHKELPNRCLIVVSLLLLMEDILHQLIGFIHPRWCWISSINSMMNNGGLVSASYFTRGQCSKRAWYDVSESPRH